MRAMVNRATSVGTLLGDVSETDQNYARSLTVAIDAALRAGAMIRAEFHRAGGPRGRGHKAVVDRLAELEIRRTLLEAFPDDGFQGEETAPEQPRERRFWCVDPNDGTTAFLKGDRGCAVSIGLVEDGVPVVGVIYAPLFPDDGGDLIVAAADGPVRRDGGIVPERVLPSVLTPLDVVTVARGAERLTRRNLESTSPARIRPVASLAYRIALCAAGEAEAGLGLHGCHAWDIAGAHAIVRAVGGECYLPGGQAIRYAPCPEIRRVFAGSEGVAVTLSSREWDIYQRKPEPTEPPFHPPARLSPGGAFRNADRLSRAQGALLGLLSGDSLGQRVEFLDARAIALRHPEGVRELVDGGTWNLAAGQPTDDGELALLLARAIVRDGEPRDATIMSAYRAWLTDAFDIGTTIGRALRGDLDPDSQANGSLMRIAPLAVYGHALTPDALALLAREESARTHVHPVCADACAAFCVAIAYAIATGETPREIHQATLRFATRARLHADVLTTLRDAERAPPDFEKHQGWVRVALQNAFHRLLHSSTLEDALVDTVHGGGDTDTNAAIAGALLGAVHGRAAIPLQWRRSVLSCRPLAGLSPTEHPRPRIYWPVDALVLAELLLLHGERRSAEDHGRHPI